MGGAGTVVPATTPWSVASLDPHQAFRARPNTTGQLVTCALITEYPGRWRPVPGRQRRLSGPTSYASLFWGGSLTRSPARRRSRRRSPSGRHRRRRGVPREHRRQGHEHAEYGSTHHISLPKGESGPALALADAPLLEAPRAAAAGDGLGLVGAG